MGGSFRQQLPFSWIFSREETTCHPNPEQPIKFQYKTRRKAHQSKANNTKTCHSVNNIKTINNLSAHCKSNQSNKNVNEVTKCKTNFKTDNVIRTKSEPNLVIVGHHGRERHRHRRKRKDEWEKDVEQFGYEIQDVDAFLTKVNSTI